MRTDLEIQRAIREELVREPSVDPNDISVSVTDGLVTLSGPLDSYSKKIAAENAAFRVNGVLDISTYWKGSLVARE